MKDHDKILAFSRPGEQGSESENVIPPPCVEPQEQEGAGVAINALEPQEGGKVVPFVAGGSPLPDRGADTARSVPPRILIADDTEFFRKLLQHHFRKAGYQVLTASDGPEALETITKNAGRLDAVLIDLSIPRMPGFDVIAEVRKLEGENPLPIVAVTSACDKEDQATDMPRECKADGLIDKSTPPDKIVRFMTALLFPKSDETRPAVRISASFTVDYNLQGVVYRTHAYTLSENGMFIHTTRPAPKGTLIEIEFTLPGSSQPIAAAAEVVYARDEDSFSLSPPGMGLSFVNPDPDQTKMIRAYIENQIRNSANT